VLYLRGRRGKGKEWRKVGLGNSEEKTTCWIKKDLIKRGTNQHRPVGVKPVALIRRKRRHQERCSAVCELVYYGGETSPKRTRNGDEKIFPGREIKPENELIRRWEKRERTEGEEKAGTMMPIV